VWISWPVKAALLLVAANAFAHPVTDCFFEAGERYNIDPLLLWSIGKTESGFNSRAINRNSGSYDIGIMQINSAWLPTLSRYGILPASLYDPCTNIRVGAWILAQNIRRHGYNWKAVGAYNAATPSKQVIYARKVLSLAHRTAQQAVVQSVRGGP